MLKKRAVFVAVLVVGLLFVAGYAEASERGALRRTESARVSASVLQQVESAGSLSLAKLLRVRFLRTLKLLEEIDAAQPDPPAFGTNGLSDGPDPIDGSGQAGSGPMPKTDEPDDRNDDGNDQTNPSSLESN